MTHQIAPVIECTVSKATILGLAGSEPRRSNSLRWAGSLCRKMCLGTPLLRMPCGKKQTR